MDISDLNHEKELVLRAKTDRAAFDALFDLYYPKIFNYLLARTGHLQLSQDLASEVFYKALTKRHLFTWKGVSFGAWLFRIASNEIKMHARRKKFISLDDLQTQGFDLPSSVSLVEEAMEAERQLAMNGDIILLRTAIDKLPSKYREVVALKYFADKKISEIAVILSKREGTVKSLLSRAIDKLETIMQPSTDSRIINREEVINP